jgi:WD40 repeat protein
LAIGGERLVLIEVATGKIALEDSSYKNNIHEIHFSQSGDLLLVSAYDGKARSYALPSDLSTLKELKPTQELKHLGEAIVYAVSLSPDERRLVTSSGDKTLKIWDRKALAN